MGRIRHLLVQNLLAEDTEEMKKAHLRFGKDLMGAPWFNGIRVDGAQGHFISDVVLENIRYRTVGGVKKELIPENWPVMEVQETEDLLPESGNYFPDWSRAAFLDIRNVRGLFLSNVGFEADSPDERPPYFIENCDVVRQEIMVFDQSTQKEGIFYDT